MVHDTVRYRLKAKLKVPRRTNFKKDVEAEAEFKKAHRHRRFLSVSSPLRGHLGESPV